MFWVGRVLLTLPVIAIMLAPPIPQPWAFLTTMLFTGLVIYGQNKNQLNNQPDHEMVKHWAMWSYFALLIISLVTFLAVEGFVNLLLATLALVALSFFITSPHPLASTREHGWLAVNMRKRRATAYAMTRLSRLNFPQEESEVGLLLVNQVDGGDVELGVRGTFNGVGAATEVAAHSHRI